MEIKGKVQNWLKSMKDIKLLEDLSEGVPSPPLVSTGNSAAVIGGPIAAQLNAMHKDLNRRFDQQERRIDQISDIVMRSEVDKSINRDFEKLKLADSEMVLMSLQDKDFNPSEPTNITFIDPHCVPVARARVQEFLEDMAKWGVQVDTIKPVPQEILDRLLESKPKDQPKDDW